MGARAGLLAWPLRLEPVEPPHTPDWAPPTVVVSQEPPWATAETESRKRSGHTGEARRASRLRQPLTFMAATASARSALPGNSAP